MVVLKDENARARADSETSCDHPVVAVEPPPGATEVTWGMIAETLTRPYRVTLPMVVLVLLVPVYLFIPDLTPVDTLHAPELSLDGLLPLRPVWSLVYGALYAFLIVLPVLVVRQEEQIRRTVFAYLTVWIAAYVCFLLYPTVAPRPETVYGEGFGLWGLRFLYDSDPPYNCFPSLHVAHSFVSALTCYRLHRGLGLFAILCALLVGLSTLYTKQHYVLDVVAGILLACAAYMVFLRKLSRTNIPDLHRRLAPPVALGLMVTIGLALALVRVVYELY
jgi:membrane-associated phospholipid phosphatase